MSTYVILVSHGDYAQGLHSALSMFVGKREDIYHIGLKEGEDNASLEKRIKVMFDAFTELDEFIILGDLIGGSPLTTMIHVLEEKHLLSKVVILGGMNLAMALNAVLLKEQGIHQVKTMILKETMEAVREFSIDSQLQEEEI